MLRKINYNSNCRFGRADDRPVSEEINMDMGLCSSRVPAIILPSVHELNLFKVMVCESRDCVTTLSLTELLDRNFAHSNVVGAGADLRADRCHGPDAGHHL